MKCPECGQDVVGDDKFCNHCGATLPSQTAPVPEQDQDLAIADDAAAISDKAQEELETVAEEPEPAIGVAEAALEEITLLPSEEETPQVKEPQIETPLVDSEPLAAGAEALPRLEAEPGAAPPPPPPVVKAKGKTNTVLIIAIVVLVILLLCCCCAIGIIAANYEQIITALEGMS